MLILISSQGHCLQLALASSEVFTDQLLPFYPWRNLTGFQQNLQIQWMYDSLFKTLILCNPASVQGEVRRKRNCSSLYFCSFFFCCYFVPPSSEIFHWHLPCSSKAYIAAEGRSFCPCVERRNDSLSDERRFTPPHPLLFFFPPFCWQWRKKLTAIRLAGGDKWLSVLAGSWEAVKVDTLADGEVNTQHALAPRAACQVSQPGGAGTPTERSGDVTRNMILFFIF